MATRGENDKIEQLNHRVGKLEVRIDEVVIPKLDKVVDYVDENRPGIRTATFLDSKITTAVIGGIVVAGIVVAARIGGGQ
ncbi:hypothetical protein [Mycolicibacterium neoaurum]|uniref:hypothetical protein n=1 Tax=Mycolicibacterium neoaurum TaxID=1795 RepID=UPI001F4D32D5|nr:hypothetical protein [Mycolicibacterium neoaurum]